MAVMLAASCVMAQEPGAKLNPVSWTLAGPKEVKAGGKTKVTATARISDGWHLYSLKGLPDGPIPTSIELPPKQLFKLDGQIAAPPPLTQRDEMFSMEVEYYESSAQFVLPLAVAADAPAGIQKLTVLARFQACDNKLCLPPRTVRVEQDVMVKAR